MGKNRPSGVPGLYDKSVLVSAVAAVAVVRAVDASPTVVDEARTIRIRVGSVGIRIGSTVQRIRSGATRTHLLHTNSFYESSRRFANQSPKALGWVLDELARTGTWAVANPRLVAEQLAPQLGLPVDVVETWQRRTSYGVQPVDAGIVATQQKVADTFLQHKLIPKKIVVADAVWLWPRG